MSNWGIVDKSLEGRMSAFFPHHHTVPSDPDLNLQFRKYLWTSSTTAERKRVMEKCKQDALYYIKAFGNMFLAKGDPKPVPFLPYDFQVEVITKLWSCLHEDQRSVRIKKPREQGISWLVEWVLEHAWHFYPDRHILLGSRKEAEIDGGGADAKSAGGEWSFLLPKIDFMHINMPHWMLPEGYTPRASPCRAKMKLMNPATGSSFAGESANPDFSRGRRYWAIFFDEFANTEFAYEILGATSATSDCKIWVSTPAGPETAFAMLGRSDIEKIDIEWWMNPVCAEGMEIVPETGKRTSPWYRKMATDMGYNPRLMANELDADESQGGEGYYQGDLFDIMLGVGGKQGTVRDPARRGEIDFRSDPERGPTPTRWVDQGNGRWLLWTAFDANGNPPRDDWYIAACDIAAPSRDGYSKATSNSVCAIVSALTGAKVAEFAAPNISAHKFAEIVVAACRWFLGRDGRQAFLIWEANGPGGATFGSVVMSDYGIRDQIYYEKSANQGKMVAGFFKGGGSKAGAPTKELFGRHAKMIVEKRYIERSYDTADEMRYYRHGPNGIPYHASSKSKEDASGAGENHGDRVIATCLACLVLSGWKKELNGDPGLPPYGSLAYRDLMKKRTDRQRVLI